MLPFSLHALSSLSRVSVHSNICPMDRRSGPRVVSLGGDLGATALSRRPHTTQLAEDKSFSTLL
jgi:hypothetical protein